MVKNPPVSAGDTRDVGSIPGSGRSPGVGNDNPLQHPCLENSRERGALWATVPGAARSQTDRATEPGHTARHTHILHTFIQIICTVKRLAALSMIQTSWVCIFLKSKALFSLSYPYRRIAHILWCILHTRRQHMDVIF